MRVLKEICIFVLIVIFSSSLQADKTKKTKTTLMPPEAKTALTPAVEKAIADAIKDARTIAADPGVIDAVKAQNIAPPTKYKKMTNAEWKGLEPSSPLITDLQENRISRFIRRQLKNYISEYFLSAADGTKVTLSFKTTSWSHKGMPKHDLPMRGQVWRGEIEFDDSTGVNQIQISVPVLDNKKPIGSLVLGIAIAKIEES